MKHKFPIFLIATAVGAFTIAFFKNNPPSDGGLLYYPVFAIIMLVLGFISVAIMGFIIVLSFLMWKKEALKDLGNDLHRRGRSRTRTPEVAPTPGPAEDKAVEAPETPEVPPTAEEVKPSPHEDQNHPNFDHRAGRIIY